MNRYLKKGTNMIQTVSWVMCMVGLGISCTNQLTDESETGYGNTVPLQFAADIEGMSYTRVANDAFEVNDTVGLYAMVGSSSLASKRYADNLCFIRQSDGLFKPVETVYYPDGAELNLISYYPFQKEGVKLETSTLKVGVAADQTDPVRYAHSDFLVARVANQSKTKEVLRLSYRHQFCRLKLTLVPNDPQGLTALLESDPKASLENLFTAATYDFETDTIVAYEKEHRINLAGKWKVEGQQLVGKEAILVPQSIEPNYHYVRLEIGGKEYICWLPATLNLQSGKQCELKVNYVPEEDVLVGEVSGEIQPWGNQNPVEEKSTALHNYIDVNRLDFNRSHVYTVYHGQQPVAEICKEWLKTTDFSSQAIVAYPVKADGKADLTKGRVVQLLQQKGKVHGGTVAWTSENVLTYTAGTAPEGHCLYVYEDRSLALTLSPDQKALRLWARPSVMRDVRGNRVHHYPLVKIGVQYWTRADLVATAYIDGTPIPNAALSPDTVGYFTRDDHYYYTSAVLASKKLLKEGEWKIPSSKSWNLLMKYLGSVSHLKAGKWVPVSEQNTLVQPATNESGFSAMPVGLWLMGRDVSTYYHKYLSYWTLEEDGSLPASTVGISSDNDQLQSSKVGNRAFVIRCVRE